LRTLLFLLVLLLSPSTSAADFQQLLQLIDYIGVDYGEAVAYGEIISPGEFAEMQDFSQGIAQQVNDLASGEHKTQLIAQGQQLIALIEAKAESAAVRALTADMRLAIIKNYRVTVIPRKVPQLERGAQLYQQDCASCHGLSGDGLGLQAVGMEPAPINFLDKARYAQRTLYGLYNTVTQGVPGTAMGSYHEMSTEDRWALAFYVGQLAIDESDYAGARERLADPDLAPLLDVQTFSVTTPAEAGSAYGPGGAAMMAWLRANPQSLFNTESPLMFSRHRLDDVREAYHKEHYGTAYRLAVEAYLEGFELVEPGLNAVDSKLRLEIEQAMTGLRNQIRERVGSADLDASIIHIKGLLDTASERLHERSLTGSAVFASAFFILVREGLEALLVVAALVAFLVKTEHRANVRYLHFGWIGALLAGVATWWVSMSIIEISGASREITEGVAALLAASILFYVGFWLHDKTTAAQWQAFIEKSMHRALSAGTLWGLAGLSFIAVYREVFETILFFQALWVQTDAPGRNMALAGVIVGAGVLAMLAWVVFRYSMRLPLRQFFRLSGLLMFVLALVFAGKGVAALQEAGYIQISPINAPRIDLLGIYPNLQGLLLQGALLLLGLYLWYGLPGRRSSRG